MAKIPGKNLIIGFLKESSSSGVSKAKIQEEFNVKPDLQRKFRNKLRKMVADKVLDKSESGKYSIYKYKAKAKDRGGKFERTEQSTRHGQSRAGTFRGPAGSKRRINTRTTVDTAIGKVELNKDGSFFFKILSPNFKPLTMPLTIDKAKVGDGDLISVKIDTGGKPVQDINKLFKSTNSNLKAILVAVIQKKLPFKYITNGFFMENGVPPAFSNKIEKEAAQYDEPDLNLHTDRIDYTRDSVITIDPFGARDHDDALSLKKTPDGGWILAVHIADVSEYVKKGMSLYKEASNRSFTRYMPWTSVPMIPDILSGNLCSLQEGKQRLAFTCKITINKNGEIDEYEFFESIVKVSRFYTYEEALKEKKSGNSELRELASLAKCLRAKRQRDGLLDFDLPESYTVLDSNRVPVAIHKKERVSSYAWIEECMLAANQCCAKFIKDHKLPGLYRIHEPPDTEDIRQFFSIFKGAHSAGFKGNSLIEKIKNSKKNTHDDLRNVYIEALNKSEDEMHKNILKSLKKAQYSMSSAGHFALGFEDYAHFTSPIRRFADLWNHNLMKKSLKGESITGSYKEEARKLARYTSETEIEVMKLERKSDKCAMAWVLSDYIGSEFKGIIKNLDSVGIAIFLDYDFIYGEVWIPLSKLKDDYYVFDERTQSLRGKRTHRRIQLNDKVNIRLEKTDPILGRTDFEILK